MSFLLLLLLLIPIIITNKYLKLALSKELTISVVRMLLQLSFAGVYLQYIFKLNDPFVNILYLFVMITIATAHSLRSSALRLKELFIPIFISVAIPQFIILLAFNLVVTGSETLFDAKFIIPVGGMLLGNCLNGNIVALNRFYNGIKEDEKRYNYCLTLGASHSQALLPYLRNSMNLAIKPTLASMATTGLVALPGMMTGQILAGSLPLTAIRYQIAIFVAILTAKYFSVLLSMVISRKKGFTKYYTLNKKVFR